MSDGPASGPRALRIVQNFVMLSGGEVVSKALGFLAFAYLARVLEPAAYGSVELVVSLSLFFALVVEFGIGPIGAREVARDPDRGLALSAIIPSARLLVAIVAAPAMVAAAWLIGLPSEAIRLAALFALALLALPFNQRWLLQGLQMMSWVSAGQVIRMGCFLLGAVIFVHEPADLVVVGGVEIIAAATLSIYFIAVQQARITPFRLTFQLGALRSLARESASLGLSQIIWALNQYLPTILVATLVGGAAIGWFGAAGRIVMSFAAFSHVYHFNLFPAGSRSLAESREQYEAFVRTSIRITSWAGGLVGLVGSLLAEPVCVLVFGDAYRQSGLVLAVMIWTVPAELLSGHARWALVAGGQQRLVLVAQIAGAVTTLAVALILVPRWGPVGAAAAMLASSLTIWFVAQLLAARYVARIPSWALLRPAMAAGVGASVGLWLDGSPWLAAAAAGGVYVASIPVLEPLLVRDARRLIAERGGSASEAGGSGATDRRSGDG